MNSILEKAKRKRNEDLTMQVKLTIEPLIKTRKALGKKSGSFPPSLETLKMLNQGGPYEDHYNHNHIEMGSSNMGLMCESPSFTGNSISVIPFGGNNNNQSPRSSNSSCRIFPTTTIPSDSPKQDHFNITTNHLLSLQRSSHVNLWAWGEENDCMISSSGGKRSRNKNMSGGEIDKHSNKSYMNLGMSAMKMKKIKAARRKVREPRFCFKTLSDVDVLDDGYKWRKYGQKVVKNTQHPRSYYRCTQDNCRVKKRVERLAEDPRMVITTYEGRHVHIPSQDEDDSSSSQFNNFFW
ncbi:WRKY domain-containing protein [Heracleum sosnowskyi]|uniref:WRKY domain-containing protein n=1 Tax=Heracleum sosnowskyi TaxID=360622 RepID=A0AAD8JJI6_9APIA|nr:WRKY domain-containing protein [Heracleum sosnowskyi]